MRAAHASIASWEELMKRMLLALCAALTLAAPVRAADKVNVGLTMSTADAPVFIAAARG